MHRFTVAEYARLMNVSEATARRRVKAGELKKELINGVTHILLERLPVDTQNDGQLVSLLQEQIEQQKSEIEYLRHELTEARQELSESRQRSDTIILQFTLKLEEQTKLLEDMRQSRASGLWARVKTAFGFAAS
jgi:TolA-binding protein